MELRTSCLDNEEFFKYQKSINILMHTILSPVTLCHKLITEEWKQLFTLMDILYGNALKYGWLNMIVYLKRKLLFVISVI